ncbi:hypothetical protein GGF32_001532 [Allomyces javanicus]|nr:hypothetical protein GGF32_001532 [Allomyces javanicus]
MASSSQSWPVESPPRPRKRIQSTLHWALDPLDYDGPSHSHLVAAPKPGKPAGRDRPLPLARVKVRKTAQLTLPADEIASGIPPPLAIPKPTIRPGPDVSQRTGFVPRAKAAGRRHGMRNVEDDDDRMLVPPKPKPKPYDVAEVQAFMKKRRLQAKQFNVHDTIKDLDKPLHRVPSPPPTATPPTANRTEILQYILKRRERERRERERAQQLHDETERKRAEQMRALEDRPAPTLAPPSTRFVPNLGVIAEHQEHDMVADAPSRRRRTVVSPSPLEDLERDLQAILEEDMVVHCETLQSDSTLRVLATSSPEASSLSLGLPPSHPSAPAIVSDPSSSSLHIEPVQSSGTTNDLTDSRESLEATPRASALGSVQDAPLGTRYSNHAEPQFVLQQATRPPSVQQGHETPSSTFSSRPTSTRPLDLYHPLAVFERTARRVEASAHAEPRTAYDAADDTSMFCSRSPSPRPAAQPHTVKHSMVVLDDTAFLGGGAGALPPRGLSPIAHHQSPRRVPERIHGERDTSFMRDLSHRVIQDYLEEELMAVDRSSSVTPRPLDHLSGSFGEPPRSAVDHDSVSTSALVSGSGSFDMAQPARATVLPPCDVSVGPDAGWQPERASSPSHPVYAPGALANGMQQSLHYAESLHLADALLESIEQFRHVAALGGNTSNRPAPSSDDSRTHAGRPLTPSWASMGRPAAATLEHNGPRSSPPPPVALALSYSEDSAHLAAMVVAATSPILGRTAPVLPPFSDSLLDASAPVAVAAAQAASPVAPPTAAAVTSQVASPLVLPAATCHEMANQTDPLPAPRRDMSVQTDPAPIAAPASPMPSVSSPAVSPAPAPAPAPVLTNSTESLKEFLATQFQANQDLIKELVNGQLAQRIHELEAKVEALQHAAEAAAMQPSLQPAVSPRMDWVPKLPARPFVPLPFAALVAATSSPVAPVLETARLPVAAPNVAVALPDPIAVDPAFEMHRDAELDDVLYDWRGRVPSISGHSVSSGSSPPVERNVRDDRPSDALTPSLETDQAEGRHPLVEQVSEETRPAQPVTPLDPALDEATSPVHDIQPCATSDEIGDTGGAVTDSPPSHSLAGRAYDAQAKDPVRVALHDDDHPLTSGIGPMDLTMSLTLSPRKPEHEREPTTVRAPPLPHYFEPMSVMSEPFAPTKSLLEALRNPSDSSISSLSVSAIGEDGDLDHDGSDAVPESIVSSVVVSVEAENAEIDQNERGSHDVVVHDTARDAAVGVDARRAAAVDAQKVEEIDESYPSSSIALDAASSVASRMSRSLAESVGTEDAASGTDSASSVATSQPSIEANNADAPAAGSRSSDAMSLSSARKSGSTGSQLTKDVGLESSIAESLDETKSSVSTEGSVSAELTSKSMPHGLDDLSSEINAQTESAHVPTPSELADVSTRPLPAEPSIAANDSTSFAAPHDSVPTVTQSAISDHLDGALSSSASVAYSMEFDQDEPGHDDTGLAAFRGLGGVQDSDQSHVVLGARPDDAHSPDDASIMEMSSVMPTLHEIQAGSEERDESTRSTSSMHSSQRSRLDEGTFSSSIHSSQGSRVDNNGSDGATASKSTVQSGSLDHSGSVAPDASDMSYVASSFEDFSQASADEEAISPPISPLPILASVPDRSEHPATVPDPDPVPSREHVDEKTAPVELTAQPQEEVPLTPDQIAHHNLLAAAATEQLLDTLLHEVASEVASLHPSLQAKPTTKSPTTATSAAVAVAPHMDVDYARNYLRFLLVHYHDTVHRATPLVAAAHPVYRHAAWNTLLAAAADEARNHLFQRLGPSAWNAAVPAHWLYNEVVAVVAKNVQFAVDHAELDVVGMLTDDLRIEAAEARAQQQQPQPASAVTGVPANSPPITALRDTDGASAEQIVVGDELTAGSGYVRDKVDVAVDDLLDQLIFESVLGTTSLMAGMGSITPEQRSRHV